MVQHPGNDVTVVAYGNMVQVAIDAATVAVADDGPSLEIIDLRSLSPIDFDTVLRSVHKTGRCVVVHEASRTLGLGAEMRPRWCTSEPSIGSKLRSSGRRASTPHIPLPG